MNWQFALFTYVISWCILMFAILPLRLGGVRSVLWNSLLAAVVTLGIYALIRNGVIPLRHVY